jgi:hypothetical protein
MEGRIYKPLLYVVPFNFYWWFPQAFLLMRSNYQILRNRLCTWVDDQISANSCLVGKCVLQRSYCPARATSIKTLGLVSCSTRPEPKQLTPLHILLRKHPTNLYSTAWWLLGPWQFLQASPNPRKGRSVLHRALVFQKKKSINGRTTEKQKTKMTQDTEGYK